jgi:outer membrane receptor protein involved in Fe transport
MWTMSYNHFAFDVKEDVPDSPLIPNAPANQFSTGVSYAGAPLDVAVRLRWVDDFPWAAGIFSGHVESYGIVDLNLGRQINQRWGLGLDIANLLDNDHYEVFGGDLLGRRALLNLTYSW